MKRAVLAILLFSISQFRAQTQGYEIKINIKGAPDVKFYLAKYYFDQTVMVDSCKNTKPGVGTFKGDKALDRGVYILVSEGKGRYIDFFVDDSQKFAINADIADMISTINAAGSNENNQIFSYAKFMTAKEKEYKSKLEQTKGKSKADSTKLMTEAQQKIAKDIQVWEADFLNRNKGTFVYDFINLKTEKTTTNVPMASNGRPDSLYQYYYYVDHYFDGVNFKDERILYTPFFADRIKRFFDQVIVQHPDTVIKQMDKILKQCEPGLLMNTLIGHFTYKYETNKAMSFDQYGNCNTFEKVFVHLADNYITNGTAKDIYDEETIAKIKEKVNILRNLLPGAKVADLHMIDTTYGKQVLAMGFDTARTSAGVTYLYNKNYEKLQPLFRSLSQINAKYTVLVFWAVDCGHCQTEIPKLHADLEKIRNSVDVKVYAVQTKEDLYKEWKKFLGEKKLIHFTHVFDPIHLNNLKETFDIQGTPVIYLLDRDKKIKAKKIAADQVVEILQNLENIEKNLKR